MNRHLKKIITELKSIEILELHLSKLHESKNEFEIRLREINAELVRKDLKIEKLDKPNFKSIYLKLTGKLDIQLELYQNHFLNLALEFNEITKSIDILEFETNIVQSKLDSLSSKKKEFQQKVKKYKETALNSDLLEYREVVEKLEYYIQLSQELKEAIKAGKLVNNSLTSLVKVIKRVGEEIYSKKKKNVKQLYNHDVTKIEDYQTHIVRINYRFTQFVNEVNDVFQHLITNNQKPQKLLQSFLSEYRSNLTNDLQRAKSLSHSYKFVKNYKSITSSLNSALRNDLLLVKEHIKILEAEELSMIKQLKKKT